MAKKTSSETNDSELHARVLAKIKPASELEDFVRMLCYGRSGAGKTRFAASAPDVLIIDVNEKGTKSVRRDYNPNVFPVEYWQEINDVYWYLQSGDHPYKSYAIDGVSAMQTLCTKFILGDEASRDASRDPDMPTTKVYQKRAELMKTQITNFRNLPLNGIFTALLRASMAGDGEEDMEGEVTYGPSLSSAIADHLEAAVDLIGYLHKKEVFVRVKKGEKITKRKVVKTRLLTGPSEKYLTKDRDNIFGEFVDSPDVTAMLDRLKEA
jgi:hypothetical protein